MRFTKKIRKYWKTAKIAATQVEAVGGPPCAGQGCHWGLGAIKSTGERWSTTNWVRVIRKYTKERHFLMKPNQNASPSLSIQNPHKHYTFLMQTSQNCVHKQVSTISKHYTFLIQTSQNCVHKQVSTISKHYTFLIQTSQNCVHKQVSTISKHYTFLIQTSQNCVHKQVSTISKHYTFLIKTASIYASVHYIKTLHFPCQNCVHMQVSTISAHYTFPIPKITNTLSLWKCPLYQNTTLYSQHTFLMQVSTISEHYTFPIQTCQNCVHVQVSTIPQHYTFPITVHHIKSLHFSYTKMPKLRP